MLSLLKNLDWKLNAAVIFLAVAGLAGILSAAPDFFYKQLLWLAIGLAAAAAVIKIDLRPLANYKSLIFGFYFLIIILLVITYFTAPTIRGAKSWLLVGGFRFQPAEFAKLSLILLYSLFFSRKHAAIARIPNLFVSFFYFLIPASLIAIQPDFGSALVLFSLWLGFLLVSGIPWRHLAILFLLIVIAGFFMWNWVLEGYQKERILGFIFPNRDVLGINYSAIQSKIAIGSAGLLGKGFRQGTQAQLGFLTESHTDFIFAALTEEWGLLVGVALVLGAVILIFRIIKIGLDAPNNFGRFVSLGAAILFGAQLAVNLGSNLGLTPVVGVTFPFLSYGGSSLIADLILAGLVQSIGKMQS